MSHDRTQSEIEEMETGRDLLYDEEAARIRDEEEAEAEGEQNERNSYVGRGRDDGCGGSWCDGH